VFTDKIVKYANISQNDKLVVEVGSGTLDILVI